MRRLTEYDKQTIEQTINYALDRLLRFKASYDLHRYLQTRSMSEWSNLADALHASGYPLSGTGVSATKSMLTTKDKDLLGTHYFDDVPLAPEQHIDEIGAFPLAAASAAYIFSILEDVGNTVIGIVYPGSIPMRRSWHVNVRADANLSVRGELNAARAAFAAPFRVPSNRIPVLSTRRLVWLKARRNAFAHDLDANIDFEKFFQYVVVLVCQISFLVHSGRNKIKHFPYEDHFAEFR